MRELVNASSGQQKVNRQSRFQALWDQTVMHAADVAALASELDKLVIRFELEVVPLECEVGALIRQVLERQLDFSTRKSLSKRQRTELEHRIAALVCDLVSMDLLDPEMHDRLSMRLAVARGFQPALRSVMSQAEQLQCFLDAEYAEADEHWQNETHPPALQVPAEQHKLDDAVFKRLFRQVAAALHPDRETEQSRLKQKHELMVQLLRVRDERDLITLLQLHKQYAAAESGLSSADETQLEAILVEHLDVLRIRRESIIYQSPRHFTVYQRFYDNNPADTDSLITRYRESLRSVESPLRVFIDEVRTLRDLRQYLSHPDTGGHPGGRFFSMNVDVGWEVNADSKWSRSD